MSNDKFIRQMMRRHPYLVSPQSSIHRSVVRTVPQSLSQRLESINYKVTSTTDAARQLALLNYGN